MNEMAHIEFKFGTQVSRISRSKDHGHEASESPSTKCAITDERMVIPFRNFVLLPFPWSTTSENPYLYNRSKVKVRRSTYCIPEKKQRRNSYRAAITQTSDLTGKISFWSYAVKCQGHEIPTDEHNLQIAGKPHVVWALGTVFLFVSCWFFLVWCRFISNISTRVSKSLR